jgi:hypothetical protein
MIEFRLSSAELTGRERHSVCNTPPYLGITKVRHMNIQAKVFWLSVEFAQREPNSAARIDSIENRPYGIADENIDRRRTTMRHRAPRWSYASKADAFVYELRALVQRRFLARPHIHAN